MRALAPIRGPRFALITAAALVATLATARAQDPFNPDCPTRFQLYETASRGLGAPNNRDLTTTPQVQAAARWLRMGNCLTFTDQLAAMETLAPSVGRAARAPSGAAIPPTWLHVGVVTSSADEARALAFFSTQGLPPRGIGAAYLGRRIYVGPFTTAGALQGGEALARAAGFAYPYPSSF